MIEKSSILYKGDMLAASFYVLVGTILILFGLTLHFFTSSLGFFYLKIGFFLFAVYSFGKGLYMYWIARNKYYYFQTIKSFTPTIFREELIYTQFRIDKKFTNRRRYIYVVVIACIVAFGGIFTANKSIILGTAIPIALIAGIELGVGLLTEFRLREYARILEKNNNIQ